MANIDHLKLVIIKHKADTSFVFFFRPLVGFENLHAAKDGSSMWLNFT